MAGHHQRNNSNKEFIEHFQRLRLRLKSKKNTCCTNTHNIQISGIKTSKQNMQKFIQNTCIHKITHAHAHRNSKNGYLENDHFFHWQPLRLKQFQKLSGMFVSVYHPAYCTNITEVPVGLVLQECFTRVLKGHITLCIVLTYMRNTCWVDVTGVFYQSAKSTHHPVYCANITAVLVGLVLQECFTRVLKAHITLCIALTLQQYLLGWCYRSVLPECWKDTSPCVLC